MTLLEHISNFVWAVSDWWGNLFVLPVHASETSYVSGGAQSTTSAGETSEQKSGLATNPPTASALEILDNIIKSVTPFLKYAGVVLLVFFVIKLIMSLLNPDETQNKTQIFIMIAISIGLIFWDSLMQPLTDAIDQIKAAAAAGQ